MLIGSIEPSEIRHSIIFNDFLGYDVEYDGNFNFSMSFFLRYAKGRSAVLLIKTLTLPKNLFIPGEVTFI